jgi:hypothetical protein
VCGVSIGATLAVGEGAAWAWRAFVGATAAAAGFSPLRSGHAHTCDGRLRWLPAGDADVPKGSLRLTQAVAFARRGQVSLQQNRWRHTAASNILQAPGVNTPARAADKLWPVGQTDFANANHCRQHHTHTLHSRNQTSMASQPEGSFP